MSNRALHPEQFRRPQDERPTGFRVGEQLPMFMTAGEIAARFDVTEGDRQQLSEDAGHGYPENRDEGITQAHAFEMKGDEAEASGLLDSVRERGVAAPVHLGSGVVVHTDRGMEHQPMITDGNHRVAASLDADAERAVMGEHPRLIPVEHSLDRYPGFGHGSPPMTDENGEFLPAGVPTWW